MMRIEYAQNPLDDKIFLDETDKKLLFYRYHFDELTQDIFDIYFDIEQSQKRDSPHPNEWVEEKYNRLRKNPLPYLSETLQKLWREHDSLEYDETKIEGFIKALQEPHYGDCVRGSTTCLKCWGESLLDIRKSNYDRV